MSDTNNNPKSRPWPDIFNKYLESLPPGSSGAEPQRVSRRYHGKDVTLWFGKVHYDDIDGWVDNVRIRHFLNQWRVRVGDTTRQPTTDEIYEFMVQADDEEPRASSKPFHLHRMATNIASNGIQEPIFVHLDAVGVGTLWDGNRRRYGTHHIMKTAEFKDARADAQWMPAYVHEPSGDPKVDQSIQHKVLTELNFKEKDHIAWPAYVKAEEIHRLYREMIKEDPNSPTLRRQSKALLAEEFGLSGWRQADRWIKMYDLANEFKDYQVEEHERGETEVDLFSQRNFEYFDELTKPRVWGSISNDPDARDEVFDWFWDGKFKAWADVRQIPKILMDPEARTHANAEDGDGVKKAIQTVIANDPTRKKDKSTANARIRIFTDWLDDFKREDYLRLEPETLINLEKITSDTAKILTGLQNESKVKNDD